MATRTFFLWFCLWQIVLTGSAHAQSITTYSNSTDFNAAMPTTGVVQKSENFAAVTSNYAVSQTTPNNWNGLTILASGFSPWGSSQYCTSLRACLNWTTSPPTTPGIYVAIGTPGIDNGTVRFTPTGRAFAFAFNYWDWNDGSQRSELLVTLSNGSTFVITGPTTVSGSPGGFMGFRIDTASIYSGITISHVTWRGIGFNSEIIGINNIQIREAAPVVQVSKNSTIWDPHPSNAKSLPGNDVLYEISIANAGLSAPDAGSIFIVDALPSQLSFWNGDIDQGGSETYPTVAPIGFNQTGGATLSFDPSTDLRVAFGTTAPTTFSQCSTLPMDSSYRSDVKFLCIRPSGTLNAGPAVPQMKLKFRAQIK